MSISNQAKRRLYPFMVTPNRARRLLGFLLKNTGVSRQKTVANPKTGNSA